MYSVLISEIILFLDFQESFSLVRACFGRTLIYILSERGGLYCSKWFFFFRYSKNAILWFESQLLKAC